MELTLTNSNGNLTTTSLELVGYINYIRKQDSRTGYKELAHYDFLKKVKEVLKGGEGDFSGSYLSSQNKPLPMYVFPRREAMLMAMSYSYDIQATVYDAWEKAEKMLKGVSEAPAIVPQTFIQALELLVVSEKAKEALKLELVEATPKIDFVDNYVDKEGSMSLRDGLKSIGKKPTNFTKQLIEDGILYYNGAGVLSAKQAHINADHFVHKITDFGVQVRVTTKGLFYLSKRYKGETK